jgi:DNA-binding Lrp family transcriptional regulator
MRKKRIVLEEEERLILNNLKEKDGARLSLRKIAKNSKLSPSTVNRKFDNLKKKKIIKDFKVILDEKKFGLKKVLVLLNVRTGYSIDNSNYLPIIKEKLKKKLKKNYTVDGNFIIDEKTQKKIESTSFVIDALSSIENICDNDTCVAIMGIYSVWGPFDIIVKLIGSSSIDIDKFIQKNILIIPGIKNSQTILIVDDIVDSLDFPLPL